MKGAEAPKGDVYEPGTQIKKALKKGTAETAEDIVNNIV